METNYPIEKFQSKFHKYKHTTMKTCAHRETHEFP